MTNYQSLGITPHRADLLDQPTAIDRHPSSSRRDSISPGDRMQSGLACLTPDASIPDPGSNGALFWSALCVSTLVGCALRFAWIAHHSLWLDEVATAIYARSPFFDLATGAGRALEPGNPPFYYLIANLWTSFLGSPEWELRVPSAIASVLTIPLLGFLGRRLFGDWTGMVAAGLYAVCPYAIELAIEARVFALLALLAVISMLLFARWCVRGDQWALWGVAVCTFLLCYAHYYGVFVPLAQSATVALARVDLASRRRWLVAMAAAAAVWSAVWFTPFLRQLAVPGNLTRLADRWLIQVLATPMTFSLGRTLGWRDASPAWLLAASLLSLVLWFLPLVWMLLRLRADRTRSTLLATWALAPVLVPLALALSGKPLYATRYATVGLPAIILLVAAALVRLPRRLAWCVGTMYLLVAAAAIGAFPSAPLKDDWRTVASRLAAELRAGDVILVEPDHEVAPLHFYFERMSMRSTRSVGVLSPSDASGPLRGYAFRDGSLVADKPVDVAGQVAEARRVWTITCPASSAPNAYRALLTPRGLRPEKRWSLTRITVELYATTSPGT